MKKGYRELLDKLRKNQDDFQIMSIKILHKKFLGEKLNVKEEKFLERCA